MLGCKVVIAFHCAIVHCVFTVLILATIAAIASSFDLYAPTLTSVGFSSLAMLGISNTLSSTSFEASLLFGICDCPAGFGLRRILRFNSLPVFIATLIALR